MQAARREGKGMPRSIRRGLGGVVVLVFTRCGMQLRRRVSAVDRLLDPIIGRAGLARGR